MDLYHVCVFLKHKADDETLDEDDFYAFLNKITAFIWAYTVMKPGITSLRGPLINEMVNITAGRDVAFSVYRFDAKELKAKLDNFDFSANRPITRAMLVWWAFRNPKQQLLPLRTRLEIEHIYAKNRTPVPENIEALGNKSMLEKDVNIRASDYRFKDKAKYYLGLVPRKSGTGIHELIEMAKTKQDFDDHDIQTRTTAIINAFMDFIADNNLLR